jgi:hypothetical protein
MQPGLIVLVAVLAGTGLGAAVGVVNGQVALWSAVGAGIGTTVGAVSVTASPHGDDEEKSKQS